MNVTNNPLISAKNIGFAYHSETILSNITFEIKKGEYLGITGPNGSGKTTLLKIILGLLAPTTGKIELLGSDPQTSSQKYKIGYVPQRLSHSEHAFPATVLEVVMTGITAQKSIFSQFTKTDKNKAYDAMRKTDVYELRDKLIHNLSGGQRQRVFIARSLAADPELLLLDEPTSGVDQASQRSFYALLKELNEKHELSIIIVSHDTEVISHEVKSVLYLNKTIKFHGNPKDFFKDSHHMYCEIERVDHV